MPYILRRQQRLAVDLNTAWRFFSDPRNLDKVTPPDMPFEITHLDDGPMVEGQLIHYRIGVFPGIRQAWVTEITRVRPRELFVDEQRVGPYKLWHHRHTFREVDGGVEIGDEVHYHLGMGPLGRIAHALFVRRKLNSIFDHRQRVIGGLLASDKPTANVLSAY